ncbi:hypothetical protein Nepgr_033280 [Nepenthes gracilis]|uniref:Uncharacterized protein n=1 Tax=Nepenthes gracilis TaxID=150966 RepID=A0AAD3Y6G5_NEPGR|nr:hypothetical protein Nepgr_033280 [Nepenthes gracilis]
MLPYELKKLQTQVFGAKYLHKSNFMTAKGSSGSSSPCRSLLRTKEVINKGFKWSSGNGKTVKFWLVWWVGDRPPPYYAQSRIPEEDLKLN